MTAIFIGKNRMGFENGHIYHIRSEIKMYCKEGRVIPCMHIYDENSEAWCPYQTLEEIMNDWDIKL